MTLIQIDRDVLSGMQKILSLSAGYEVNIVDELEYFDPGNSSSWILAIDSSGQHLGFIRQFKQGPSWSLGEIYVKPQAPNRKELSEKLVKKFQTVATFEEGHRLRFDLLKSDSTLNEVIQQFGYSQQAQTFLHFELITGVDRQVTFTQNKLTLNPLEVAEVLTYLHPVSVSEAVQWISSGTIRAVCSGARVVAVAQIYDYEGAIEINRIATHADFLRKGFGTKLIDEILLEAKFKGKNKVFLKVEDIRTAAILLYKKSGFAEDPSKTQRWHSSWY